MSHETKIPKTRIAQISQFLLSDSRLLIAATVLALVWVHVDYFTGHHTLDHFVHKDVTKLLTFERVENHGLGDHAHVAGVLTVHMAVGLLMAWFFGVAGKEVRESTLPGGDLNPPSKAVVPLMATLGGVLGPVGVFFLLAWTAGKVTLYANGWAIPTATDIAFSYVFGNKIFGKGSPQVKFLLLLAIADDALCLLIIALGYTDFQDLHLMWAALPVIAVIMTIVTRRLFHGNRYHSHWWYMPWMLLSLYGFFRVNVEPALAFVPVIWFMPHAKTDKGLFAHGESERPDTLNQWEHFWKPYVEVILFFFALVNVGVPLAGLGFGTVLVAVGLIVGKTVGVVALTWVAVKVFGLELPKGMDFRHVTCLGMIAGIGFTVSLFVAAKAFATPETVEILAEVKLGALFSFLAAPLAYVFAKLVGIKPVDQSEELDTELAHA